jgi:hypothetical protein
MLKEMFLRDMKQKIIEDPSARFYIIAQEAEYVKFEQIRDCPALTPSIKLLQNLESGLITQEEYRKKYTAELRRPLSLEMLKFIRQEGQENDVYFVSDSDDRFTVLNVINTLQ